MQDNSAAPAPFSPAGCASMNALSKKWEQGRAKRNPQAAALVLLVRNFPDTLERLDPRRRRNVSPYNPVDGRMVVWFCASVTHCAFYPGGVVKDFADQLAAFDLGKGTIRFHPDHPLPNAVVKQIVKARIAQNEAKANATRARTTVRKRSRSSASPRHEGARS